MAKKTTSQTDLAAFYADTLKSMQSAFQPNLMVAPQAEHFWQIQDHLLDETESFMRHWFERRHEATRTALAAARKTIGDESGTPGEAMQTIAEWQRHSMERMVEDAREWLDTVQRCASYVSASEVEAAEEVLEGAKKATKSTKSEPV